jgi:DinB superfamily
MDDSALRHHLLDLLAGHHAHLDFDAAVEDLPPELRGVRPPGLAHSPWELLEHLRLAQWDILEFSRDREHVSPPWPAGYWPEAPAPPGEEAWETSVEAFRADLAAMCERVENPASDLFTPFPWGDGQTLLREALLVADHNAYHLGQLVDARRALGAWPA